MTAASFLLILVLPFDIMQRRLDGYMRERLDERLPDAAVSKSGTAGIRRVLAALGHPENTLRVVHITGTNGKGSVARYTERLLRLKGFRTGLFTSPAFQCTRDMIRIDGCPISEMAALALCDRIDAGQRAAGEALTHFEYLCVLAVLAFQAVAADIAIFEVGLGGAGDATNIFREKLVDVIHRISGDHLHIIGPTVADAVREKSGIIQSGDTVVYACDDEENTRIIEAAIRCKQAVGRPIQVGNGRVVGSSFGEWMYTDDTSGITYGYRGIRAQAENIRLFLAVAAVIGEKTGLQFSPADVLTVLRETIHPGRFEYLPGGWLLDGAHNPAGLRALTETLRTYPLSEAVLLTGVLRDKDTATMAGILAGLPVRIFVTAPPMRTRALPAAEWAAMLRDKGAFIAGVGTASAMTARMMATSATLRVVAGSLYLVSEVKSLLMSSERRENDIN